MTSVLAFLAALPCGALLPTFPEALQRNLAEHAVELADSKKLGFARAVLPEAASAVSAAVATEAFDIDRQALWPQRYPKPRRPPSRQAPAAAPDLLSEGWAFESLPRQWDGRGVPV